MIRLFILFIGAKENQDKLCLALFAQAGEILAEHILGVGPKIAEVICFTEIRLDTVCSQQQLCL